MSYVQEGKDMKDKINIAHWNAVAESLKESNKKWWFNPDGTPTGRTVKTLGMLMISEVAEAMEGVRKNLDDDHLPQYKMFDVELADTMIRSLDFGAGYEYTIDPDYLLISDYTHLIDSVESKKCEPDALYDIVKHINWMIDAHISKSSAQRQYTALILFIITIADEYNVDLEKVVAEKIAYNAVRADHKLENRNKENGKKF